ncbi:unnamed protein product [Sphagnum troendelagicum]|uniref:Remorin C-terminal domain-containing protein n=1 Tax=Sphagnum troendelagicum TaxID=128251 RepID=A0ABP0TU54_9BRYO
MGGHHHHQEQQHAVVEVVEEKEKPSLLLLQEEDEEEDEEEDRKNVRRSKPARLTDHGQGEMMTTRMMSTKSEVGSLGSGVISPKSVITRFMSPGSSSSSSMEHGLIGARGGGGGALVESSSSGQCKWLPPRHDRGYSISDGEVSDSDSTFVESSSTTRSSSREFAKSGPLESLPETHSLALDAAVRPSPASTTGAAAAAAGVLSTTNVPPAFTASASTMVSMELMQITTAAAAASVVEIEDRYSTQCRPDHWVQAAAAGTTSTSHDHQHCAAESVDRKKRLAYLRRSQPTTAGVMGANGEAAAAAAQAPPQTRLQQSMRIMPSTAAATDHTTVSETEKSSNHNAKAKQATQQAGPQATCSASMGNVIFAYPGTPQRLFPGALQAMYSGSPTAVGSPRAGGNGNGFYSTVSSSDQKGAAGLKASSGTSRFHQGFFSGPLLNPIISLKPTPSKWDDAEKWITSPGHHESSSPAPAASGHSHQQQLHHHHHQYHEPILTGRRHSIAGAADEGQLLESMCDGAPGSPEYSTSNAEKLSVSPRSNSEAIGIGKGHIRRSIPAASMTATTTTTQKKRSKTLSFGDLSKRFDLSRAVVGPGNSNSNSQDIQDDVSFEENRQLSRPPADHQHHLMMMPKYLSSDYNVPAQSTSFRRSIASSRVVEGAGPGSLPNFPHQQLPVNVSSVDESKSPKCAHDACDSSTKEQESSEAPSSSFDSCTKDEFCSSSSINVQIPKQGLCSVSMREIGTDPPTPPTLHNPQPSLGHRNMATQMTPIESQKNSIYNQKEEKILAWEVLEKSKAETELKKTELKIEKMRVHAIEKMQSRVTAVSQKAEQMRAVAESNRIEKAAKTSARVQQIIITGQLPRLSHNPFRCCFS